MRFMYQMWLMCLGLIMMFCAGCALTQPDVLTYAKHSLDIDCYNASDIKVKYGSYNVPGRNNGEVYNERKICRDKTQYDEKRSPSLTGMYHGFEGTLRIQWHDLDDSVIDTVINLDELFPNKVIPHKEDPSRIYWPIPTPRLPFIVIEVNNRTLSIYSDVDIFLLPEDGNVSNKKSHRNRTLVFSKTY